jgi:hypothetical protein
MALRPGDRCLAPPPYISPERVEAVFKGLAPPSVINELGRAAPERIPRVYVECEGEVYGVDAEAVSPING